LTGGVPATSFYSPTEKSIVFNLYSKFTGYDIPGPAVAVLKKRAEEKREHAREFM
jgi:cellulase